MPPEPSARSTERSGICASPRASAASTSAIASMHSAIGRCSFTSASLRMIAPISKSPPISSRVGGIEGFGERLAHRFEMPGAHRSDDDRRDVRLLASSQLSASAGHRDPALRRASASSARAASNTASLRNAA